MRKALIPAFLLVLGAAILGATVFREQLANAMPPGPPPQNVVVTNTSTNPVPVQQVGTSTTSVSGTVNLDSTDSGHLANIQDDLGNLKFDSSGNLKTTSQQAAPGAVTQNCLMPVVASSWTVHNDGQPHTLCTDDFYVTDLTASGMDDDLTLDFDYQGNLVLQLNGSSHGGTDSYQLDLTHPLHVDQIVGSCGNNSTECNFNLELLGNSTGS